MGKQEQVEKLTRYMADFTSYISKVLPDDITAKLEELAAKEDGPLSKVIYDTMKRNQRLARELNRPSCQDTGVLQFWVTCGVSPFRRAWGDFEGGGGKGYHGGPLKAQQRGDL